MRKAILTSLISTAIISPVMAQDGIALFGIPFNQPLSMQECPWKDVPDFANLSRDRKATKRDYMSTRFSDTLCYTQLANIGEPPVDGSVGFVFPLAQAPSMGQISGRLVNGRLAVVNIYTRGIKAQTSDLEILTRKFGEPTLVRHPTVQNRMGASFNTTEAAWNLPGGLSVVYASTLTTLDSGIVIVSTPEGKEAVKREQEEIKRKFGGTEL